LSSDVFWWWYTVTSNCRHLNPYDIQHFPLPASVLEDPELERLGAAYLEDLQRHSRMRSRRQRQTGRTETQTFTIRHSRPLLERIGKALAPHYGFDPFETDFLLHFEIKFRLGVPGDPKGI